MTKFSSLAVALSVAIGAMSLAGAADASTTTMKKPEAATCVATKTKPCAVKHAGVVVKMHKKHKLSASAAKPAKPLVKKS